MLFCTYWLDHELGNGKDAGLDPSPIKELSTIQEVQQVLQSLKTSIILSFDPYRDWRLLPLAKKLLKNLSEFHRIKEHQVSFYTIDLEKLPEAVTYIATPMFSFTLIIQTRLKFWHDFRILMRRISNFVLFHEFVKEKAVDFIEDQMDRIPNPLTSMEQLAAVLKRRSIIALYLGKNDTDYNRFEALALQRMDCTYYYTFDPELARLIFKKYRAMIYQGENFFVFLRSEDAIDEFDIYQLEYEKYHAYYNIKDFENFYLIEKYPKLRNETHYGSIIENALGGYTVLMYLREENANENHLKEFKAAVKGLDKRLVFCHVLFNSPEFTQIKNDLGVNEYPFHPDKVYMIFYGKTNGFSVHQLTDSIKSMNIVFFVQSINKMQNAEADRALEESGQENTADMTVSKILEIVQKIEEQNGHESFINLLLFVKRGLLVLIVLLCC